MNYAVGLRTKIVKLQAKSAARNVTPCGKKISAVSSVVCQKFEKFWRMSGSSEGKPVPRTLVLDLVEGVLVPPKSFRREVVRDALRYVARPGDIFLATYPKTGATWTQYTLWCLMNLRSQGEEGTGSEMSSLPSFTDIMTKCVPFLELVGRQVAENLPEPRIIKHHLSFTASPYHRDAKYVVIVRNPFDCVVSYYHHCMGDRVNLGMRPETTFDEFFEDFVDGHVPFGHYFEHILSWYAHRNDPNVFFFYYEHFKRDPAGTVLALAKFIDKKIWGRLRADEALLNQFLERTSFGSLKSSVAIQGDVHAVIEHKTRVADRKASGVADGSVNVAEGQGKGVNHVDDKNITASEDSVEALAPLSNFFRKGQVGDWRRHFNPEQKRRLRDLYDRRMRGTEMWDVWEEYLD